MLPVERLAIASTMLFARRETGETPLLFVTMFLGDPSTLRGTTSLLSESSFLFFQLFSGETMLFFNAVMLSLETAAPCRGAAAPLQGAALRCGALRQRGGALARRGTLP